MEAAKKTQSAKELRQAALDNLHQRIAEANSQPPLQHDPDCVLEVQDLYKYFPIKTGLFSKLAGYVRAVDGISFKIKKGTTMGLVGESGCGKTTVGKTVLRLTGKTAGQVLFNGIPIHDISRDEMRKLRPKIQMIFQDPYSSLSPRMPVSEIIGEAVREHGLVPENEMDDYLDRIMKACGLQPYHKDRYPHEFSGGQRQRIGIARAIILQPDLIIADEPISALDVSIQAQVINLMNDLRDEMGLTIMFIAHDLSVVKYFSDRIGVMYFGKMVELADSDELFAHPMHPYTRSLLSAIPLPDPNYEKRRKRITYVPSLTHDYSKEGPEFKEVVPNHFVLCNTAECEKYRQEIAEIDAKTKNNG